MYKLLGKPVVKSKGSLEHGLVSVTKGEHDASLCRPTWYEMTPLDEENKFPYQSPTQVAKGSSSLEGATTAREEVIIPRGGSSQSTFYIGLVSSMYKCVRQITF